MADTYYIEIPKIYVSKQIGHEFWPKSADLFLMHLTHNPGKPIFSKNDLFSGRNLADLKSADSKNFGRPMESRSIPFKKV